MEDLAELRQVMSAFQEGALTPEEFVDRYSALWDELTREQDAAIAAHPSVGEELGKLRRMQLDGEVAPDQYLQRVQELYAQVQGMGLPPGTAAAEAVDQLYAVADAYIGGDTGQDGPLVSESELHATVARTLTALERA